MTLSTVSTLQECAIEPRHLETKARARGRYHMLDCWRGVACLMVVIAHAAELSAEKYLLSPGLPDALLSRLIAFLPSLGAGVMLFFVISGYCITASIDGRQTSFARFTSRRFFRIYPAYWAAFFLMTFGVEILEFISVRGLLSPNLYNAKSPLELSWAQLLGNLTLTETWRFHLFGDERKLFLKHVWTLCYEEQFYLIVGVLLCLCPKAFFPGIVGVTLVSAVSMLASSVSLFDVIGFGIDLLWFPFAAGVLVYYRLWYARGFVTRQIDLGLLFLATFVVALAFLPWDVPEIVRRSYRGLVVSSVFSIVLIQLKQFDYLAVTIWPMRVFADIGKMSYSLYLVHAPIVAVLSKVARNAGFVSDLQTMLVTIPICLASSLIAGRCFYSVFEEPFLYRKQALHDV